MYYVTILSNNIKNKSLQCVRLVICQSDVTGCLQDFGTNLKVISHSIKNLNLQM